MADPLSTAVTPDEIAGLSEEPETTVLPNGEHLLTIKAAKKVQKEEIISKKTGEKFRSAGTGIQLVLVDSSNPDSDPVFDFAYYPNGDQDKEDLRKLKRIFHAAGVPIVKDEILPSDLVGKTVAVNTRSTISNGEPRVNVNWPKAA